MLEREPVQPAPGHEALYIVQLPDVMGLFTLGLPRDGWKGVCRKPTPSRAIRDLKPSN